MVWFLITSLIQVYSEIEQMGQKEIKIVQFGVKVRGVGSLLLQLKLVLIEAVTVTVIH